MTAHVKDGGTWKEAKEIHVKDGGIWKAVKEAWVKDGGTWKSFFKALAVSITNQTVSNVAVDPATATATYTVNTDGHIRVHGGGSLEEWLVAGTSSEFDVRATHNSGSTPSGTYSSWLNLGTSRSWSLSQSGIGSLTGTITIEIRESAGGTILDSASVTLNPEVISSM